MTTAHVLPVSLFKTIRLFVVIFACLLGYALVPLPAHAASLTDTQVQAVVSLLSSFGAEQSVLNNVQLALHGASRDDMLKSMGTGTASSSPKGDTRPGIGDSHATSSASFCGIFARTLARGTTGNDVSNLQSLLERTGDLHGTSTTGYFGSTTEEALKAWQARQGIATSGDRTTTGFGAAGPQTRAALMANCMKMGDEHNPPGHGDDRFGSSTASSTRPTPPMPPRPHSEHSTSTTSTLQTVSTLLLSGMASVYEGYLSLFGQ